MANSFPDSDPADLINKIKEYPNNDMGITDLRPSNLYAYATALLNDEAKAIKMK